MSAYYNENDLKTAAWLRELIKAGLIPDGEVDTRSIVDVRPSELQGFRHCHFFAGLAHGVPARVGRLRGYGNAIVPELGAEFIAAYMEAQRNDA